MTGPSALSALDLNDVAVFVKVVQACSFSGAGRALGMPRSTVSRRIAELERRLGARLLHRTTRRLQLTDIGRSYYERCAAALRGLQDAEAQVRETQAAPRGKVRFTAPHDFGPYLAPVVAEFVQSNPEVELEIQLTQRMVDLVGEGFDIALRATSRMLPDSTMVAKRIAFSYGRLFASPEYLAERGTPKRPADLSEHDWVVLGPARTTTLIQLSAGDDTAEVALRSSIHVNDPVFARDLAVAHTGVTLLPAFLCTPEVERGLLVPVLPEYATRKGGTYVIVPSTKHLSVAVSAFRTHLVERLKQLSFE